MSEFARYGLTLCGGVLATIAVAAALWVLGAIVLGRLARFGPDRGLERYRLAHAPKFIGFDEGLFLRGEWRARFRAEQILRLRRIYIAVRIHQHRRRSA